MLLMYIALVAIYKNNSYISCSFLGQKGDKGERGQTDDSREEIVNIKETQDNIIQQIGEYTSFCI